MEPPPIIRFDKTITMGNVLTIGTLIAGMGIAWFKMESRLAMVEMMTAQNTSIIGRQTDLMNRIEVRTSQLDTLMRVYIPLHQLTDNDVSRAARGGPDR